MNDTSGESPSTPGRVPPPSGPSEIELSGLSLDALLHTALLAADAACRVHRMYSGRVGVADAAEKGVSDFVSRVDFEAQVAALEVIRERYPDHDILAEEEEEEEEEENQDNEDRERGEGEERGQDGEGDEGEDPGTPLWIVDPLDGTTNFLNGHPMYCASVAAWIDGRPLVGAVSCSSTGERWWATRGRGAFKNGRSIRTSPLRRLSHALIGTGFPFKALDELPVYLEQLGRVLRSTAGVRRGGSAAMDLCHLADGTFDGFWEQYLKPWDVAAGILIVREAGGVVTRIDRSSVALDDGTILGGNGRALHAGLGALVRNP